MSIKQRLGVAGLATNPNPHMLPDGALLQADEIVIRRPGMAEPRPGFKVGTSSSLASLYGLLKHPDGKTVRVGPVVAAGSTTYGGTAGTTAVYDGNQTTPTPAALSWDRDAIRGIDARGNLYLTTKDGLRVLWSGDTAAALIAGLIPPNLSSAALSASGTFLPTAYAVSYRLVLKRKDSNGLITLSAPSARIIVANASGVSKGVALTFSWRGRYGYKSDDVIQIYRSEIAAGTTSADLHFLRYEYPISSGTINADGNGGTGTWTDTTASGNDDASLGESLYINSTATDGGAAASNIRPPAATDLTLYQGSLFWSGLTDYARKTMRWVSNSTLAGFADGIGRRSYTGTRTHNSNTITGVSSVVGLKVGMMLSSATNWSLTQPVIISAIVGSDVTVTSNWGGGTDGAPVSLVFTDSICLGATNNPANYFPADFANVTIEGVNQGLIPGDGGSPKSATVFAYGVGDISTNLTWTVVFEAFSALDSFTISATHGVEYNPPIPEPSVTPETVAPTSLPNVIGWSQRDLPEHRRLADRTYVGNAQAPILRCFGTKDAVWILKGKGDSVYRLSGMGEETGFRLDKFSDDTYLLHPNLACALDETVYFWSNKGLMALDDGGLRPVSDPFIGVDTRALETALDHSSGDNLACFAVANSKNSEVVFGLPQTSLSASPDGAERVYVFNTLTKGLTKWFVGNTALRCAAYDIATRALLLGRNDSGTYRVERLPSETYVTRADAEFALTVSTIVGNVVTLTGAVSGWTPAVGDLVRVSTGFAVITVATSTTVFTVNDGTAIATGAGASYVAFTSAIKWNVETMAAPSMLKRFGEMIVHFDDIYGLYTWALAVDSSRSYGSAVSTARTTTFARTDKPYESRALVSRTHTMASRLYPSVSITQADSRWAIGGATVVGEPLSTRVHR
jgi:hypothetical protein